MKKTERLDHRAKKFTSLYLFPYMVGFIYTRHCTALYMVATFFVINEFLLIKSIMEQLENTVMRLSQTPKKEFFRNNIDINKIKKNTSDK